MKAKLLSISSFNGLKSNNQFNFEKLVFAWIYNAILVGKKNYTKLFCKASERGSLYNEIDADII